MKANLAVSSHVGPLNKAGHIWCGVRLRHYIRSVALAIWGGWTSRAHRFHGLPLLLFQEVTKGPVVG